MKLKESQISAARRGIEIGCEDFMLGRSSAAPGVDAVRAGCYKPGEVKAFVVGYLAGNGPDWQAVYKEGKRDLLALAIMNGVFELPGYEARNLV